MKKTLLKALVAIALFVFSNNGFSQTPPPDQVVVQINSGNPNFPFPQFLEYDQGKTLAKYNAEGVTHCDMEKAMRQAYQVLANRFYYTGDVVDGVRYIRGNDGCPYDCAEGEGYALLAAAYMGDRETFNGLWMRVHDDMMVNEPRYRDGVVTHPNYRYGKHTIKEESGDAAADGDMDIALALLMATKQWGPLSNVTVNDGNAGTKTMSYLEEAMKVIYDLVDTVEIRPLGNPGVIDGWVSGHIGIDGYPKGGNTFKEVTDWANVPTNVPKPSCEVYTGCGAYPGFASYLAPAYYRSFEQFAQDNSANAWITEQFRRAEASSEWLLQQSVDQGRIPVAGSYSVNGGTATFTETDPKQGKTEGESFRMAWRTVLNGMWRGNGIYDWDPINHTYSAGSNTTMQENADAMAAYLKDPGICAALGASPDPLSTTVNHSGVSQISQDHYGAAGGSAYNVYKTNYTLGTGAPSAVMSGDEQLIADLYRQLELKWDDQDVGLALNDTIIENSTPKYFHGWFRLLGMLTLTGNLHAPEDMVAGANVKVYMDIDRTFAYVGDEVVYTVSYRNYGKLDAEDVQITVPISAQFEVVDPGSGTVNGSNLVFDVGIVDGLESSGGAIGPTEGEYTFKVKVVDPQVEDRVCLQATISASNAPDWISNEYPNNCTYTMERNCVDILGTRALQIEKTASRTEVNPGMEVDFTLEFENSTDAGWLNGGRKHVNFSYAYAQSGPNSYFHLFRNWNNAEEAYIDLSNYRVSYYMADNVNKGIGPGGWSLIGKNLQTGNVADFQFIGEEIPPGSDADGNWDQRIIIQFPPDITAPTHAVFSHLNNRFQLHKGTLFPIWYSVQMEADPPSDLFSGRVQDDWSFMGTQFQSAVASGAEPYYLIGPNYADYDDPGVVMDRYDRDACTAFFGPDEIYTNVLVEEFDGFTWRRISGEGPLPGREMYNVVVLDTLPQEFQFVSFLDDMAEGIQAQLITSGGYEIIRWEMPKVLVGMAGDLKYKTVALGNCPGDPDNLVTNRAWIYSDTDTPVSDDAQVNITCGFVSEPPAGTTMTKTADKTAYQVGETINYTIDFEQTLGSISNPDLTDPSRWTAIDPNGLPTISGGQVDFSGGNRRFIYENFSHGKNGTFTIHVDNDGQETFGILLRHTGGTRAGGNLQGIYLEFQLAYWGNQVNMNLYEDGVLQDQIVQEGYAAPYTDAVIKIELNENAMNMWINDLSGLPFYTFSGLTKLDAGYIGFSQGGLTNQSEWSAPKILSWRSQFDSAFELDFADVLPAEVSFVSASNSGTESAGRVTWPTIPGPVLYGETIQYTLSAILDACPASGKVINTAYVNPMGYAVDSIGAESVVDCGSTGTPPTADFSADMTEICVGETVEFTDASTGTITDYAWDFDDGTLAAATTVGPHVITFNTAGTKEIVLTVTGPDGTDTETKTAYITVNALPTKPTITNFTYCEGDDTSGDNIEDNVTGTNLTWYDLALSPLGTTPTLDASTAVTFEYAVSQTNAYGCEGDTAVIAVVINPVPSKPTVSNFTYCEGDDTSGDNIEGNVTGTNLTWYDLSLSPLGTTPTLDASTSGTFEYAVSQNNADGCEGDTAVIAVVVNPIPAKPTVTNFTYCEGDDTSGDNIEDNVTGTNLTWYDLSLSPLGTTPTLDASTPGTFEYAVSQANADGCEGDTAVIAVVVNPAPAKPTVTNLEFCEGDITTAEDIENYVTATGTINWYDLALSTITKPTISTTTPGVFEYAVSQTSVDGCEGDTAVIAVVINALPAAPVPTATPNPICDGEDLQLAANGDGSGTFAWTGPNSFTSILENPAVLGATTTAVGTYSVTETINGCTSPAGTVDVDVVGAVTVSNIVETCNAAQDGYTVSFDIADGDAATYEVEGVASGASYTSAEVPSGDPYSFTVTDQYGCSPVVVSGTFNCSCNVTGALTAASTDLCDDATTVDFTVTMGGGVGGVYNIEITAPDGTILPYAGLAAGANTIAITNIQDGVYSLTLASDGNCDGSTSGAATLSLHAPVTVSNIVETCNAAQDGYTVSFDIADGDAASYEVEGSPSAAAFVSTEIPSGDTYSFTVTDQYGCSPVVVSGTFNCSCDVTGDLSAASIDLCDDATTVDFTVTLAGGSGGVYNIEITAPDGTVIPYAGLAAGANTIAITDIQDGAYSLTLASDGNCDGATSGSATLVLHDPVTVSNIVETCNAGQTAYTVAFDIADGDAATYEVGGVASGASYVSAEIPAGDPYSFIVTDQYGCSPVTVSGTFNCSCNVTADLTAANIDLCDDATSVDFEVTLAGGAGTYDIEVTAPDGTILPYTGLAAGTSNITITNLQTGAYEFTAVTDGNCVGVVSGIVNLDIHAPVVVSNKVETCNVGLTGYTVTFDIANGDPTSYEVSGTPSTATFTSPEIANGVAYNYTVTDQYGCSPVIVSGTRDCSCPVVGTLTAGTQSLCADVNTVNFTVNLTGATNAPYSIDITAPNGDVITETGLVDGDNVIAITNLQNGVYTLTRAGDQNCDGSASGTATLTINDLPTAVVSGGGAVCDDNTATATVSIALTGAADYTLTYTDGTTPTTVTATASPYTFDVTSTGAATYTVTALSDNNGCAATAAELTGNAVVSTIALPEVTISGGSNICDDGIDEATILIEGTVGTGEWSGTFTTPSITESFTTTAGTFSYNTMEAGAYTLQTVTDQTTGCSNTVTGSTVVNVTAIPVVASISGTTAICTATTTSVTYTAILDGASGPVTSYDWLVPNGTILSGQGTDQITVQFTGFSGNATVQVTPEGCSTGAPVQITVTVSDVIDPTVSIDPISTLCFDADAKTFIADIDNAVTPTVSWSIDGTFIGNGTNTASGNTISTFDYYDGGTLRVDVSTANTCTTTPDVFAEVVLSVKDPAPKQVPTISSSNFCEGEGPMPLHEGNFIADPALQYNKIWYVDRGFGPEQVGVNTSTIQVNESGTYWLEVSHDICTRPTRSEEVTVTVNPTPVVTAASPVYVEVGEWGELAGSVTGPVTEPIMWTTTSADGYLEEMDIFAAYTPFLGDKPRSQVMRLNAENNGCTAYADVIVVIRPDVYIPKVFTPNNDGENEFWEIPNIEGYPDAKVRIFNRWGNEVWRNDKPYTEEQWDGMRNGTPMPIATYYYIIDFGDGNKEPKQGSVTILR